MNLSELQAELRHFAAERDWQPVHTPKNLSTALMVEAAKLAEIYQWMTPEESLDAHQHSATQERIGQELANVLLYVLQVADQGRIDLVKAVRDKLTRDAVKYPAMQTATRVSAVRTKQRGIHVLLDYENVQPTEDDLRMMVPGVSRVWVFHGPHQRQVEQRFASFGCDMTAVPISRTGRNALDFHLAFYMGYIASRNEASEIVVVANDKGYEPVLEHAKSMGFSVRRQEHGQSASAAPLGPMPKVTAAGAAKHAVKQPAAKGPARKVTGKQPLAKQLRVEKAVAPKSAAPLVPGKAPANRAASVRPVPGTSGHPLHARSVIAVGPRAGSVMTSPPLAVSVQVSSSAISAEMLAKIVHDLRNMGGKRPTRAVSLRRALKSCLGAETGDESIELALDELIAAGVVVLGARSDVSYPAFDARVAG